MLTLKTTEEDQDIPTATANLAAAKDRSVDAASADFLWFRCELIVFI